MRKQVAEQFRRSVADHAMEVQRDDGLHRHLTFSKPGTCIDRFHLVTWPGYLCFCGDWGEYVFSRIPDMFEFFRSDGGRVNPQYWSEKCCAIDRDGIREFSEEKFRKVIADYLREHKASREVRQAVKDEVLSELERGEHAAVLAAHDFHHDGFHFSDFYECELAEYTHRFLWCCHAIVWGIAKYDAAMTRKNAQEPATT
jgi:hypothetical protein